MVAKVTDNVKVFFSSTILLFMSIDSLGKRLCEVSISVEIKSFLDTRILVILAFLALIPSLLPLITRSVKN